MRRFLRGTAKQAPQCSLADPDTIPVYINNRNRLSTMKEMINWLLSAGTKKIIIVDNASSYPLLLEYYKNLPSGVVVEMLGRNGGPRIFWEMQMHLRQSTPYIVTDSDLVPDRDCPKDLVHQLNVLLHTNPYSLKVGAGLRIDDIPNVVESEKLNGWSAEEQKPYWSKRQGPRAFYAPVDTTFALYGNFNPEHSQSTQNLRMDFPYVMRHMPWYVTKETMSEEEKYYRSHTEIGPQGLTHPWSHNHHLFEPREEHPWKDNPKEVL